MITFIALGLLVIASICIVAQAEQLIESDDFSGTDGSSPNSTIWELRETHGDDYVRIYGNTLKAHSQGNGYAVALGKTHHEENNLTLLVDWKMTVRSGRPIDIRIISNDSVRNYRWVCVMYDADAGYGSVNYRYGGREVQYRYNQDYVLGRWYTVNLTVWTDQFNVTIKERDTGNVFLSLSNTDSDPLGSDNFVWLGVYQYHTSSSSEGYYDDYRLFDITIPKNKAPLWGDLPSLEAMEDVPLTYDFSMNISDPDDEPEALSISSVSGYVTSVNRFNVTFVFPEGVLTAYVPLLLTDGKSVAGAVLEFVIVPVNDPPDHTIPGTMMVVEDIPFTVNLTPFVSDVDNPIDDLILIVDDPFATTDGLELTVLFSEGITDYYLTIYVSDGLLRSVSVIHFNVIPVDDPPEIVPMGEFSAIEDQLTVLDLTPYILDPDTEIDDIQVMAWDANCTVVGRELHFYCGIGGITYQIDVEVTDGTSRVTAPLTVVVHPVNDGPIIAPIPSQVCTEEEERTLDLSHYLSDEDTPLAGLILDCTHPAVIRVQAHELTLFYKEWEPPHEVMITVSDGFDSTTANFTVQVRAVNDPPRLTWRSGTSIQGMFKIDEGTDRWYAPFIAEDEDDEVFTWSITSEFYGFEIFSNSTIHTYADKGDIGEYSALIVVTDAHGAEDSMLITLVVQNVNDPPYVPVVLSPLNHSVFMEGDNITFDVSVFDPDQELGQVLNVKWSTNVTGSFMERRTDEAMDFVVTTFQPGMYHVDVMVTDGDLSRSVWFEFTVIEPPKPPSDEPSFQVTVAQLSLILLVAAIVIAGATMAVYRTKGDKEPAKEGEVGGVAAPVIAEIGEKDPEVDDFGTDGWVPDDES
jgi:hypothetical protein